MGLYGCPTTVNNVESIAVTPTILRRGAGWYTSFGRPNNHGTKLNGYPIQQCTLEAGDILSLGGVEIIYGEEFALQSTRANAPINADTDTPLKP